MHRNESVGGDSRYVSLNKAMPKQNEDYSCAMIRKEEKMLSFGGSDLRCNGIG